MTDHNASRDDNDSQVPHFRTATEVDWQRIWPVFHAVVASGDTYMFDPFIGEADAKAAWLFVGLARQRTYVAELDGEFVGTAILRPSQPGQGDHVANAAWMIHPGAAGRGIGRRFATHVLSEACELGFEAMQFNAVVASNDRAVQLWNSIGFDVVGRVPAAFRTIQGGREDVLIMHMALNQHRE